MKVKFALEAACGAGRVNEGGKNRCRVSHLMIAMKIGTVGQRDRKRFVLCQGISG